VVSQQLLTCSTDRSILLSPRGDCGSRAGGDAEFAHDMLDVDLDGAFPDPEAASDGLVGLAATEAFEHCLLPLSETIVC